MLTYKPKKMINYPHMWSQTSRLDLHCAGSEMMQQPKLAAPFMLLSGSIRSCCCRFREMQQLSHTMQHSEWLILSGRIKLFAEQPSPWQHSYCSRCHLSKPRLADGNTSAQVGGTSPRPPHHFLIPLEQFQWYQKEQKTLPSSLRIWWDVSNENSGFFQHGCE